MTTYLATYEVTRRDTRERELLTVPFCSENCAYENHGLQFDDGGERHNHYEFDETCANCGSLIKASK